MKVALVYDRVSKWGGAERILLALHEIFPDASLYTSVYHQEGAPWAKVFQIKTTFLQNIPLARKHHELFGSLMPIAFEQLALDTYDLVISVTSESAKGIITKPSTKHICYCLTPTRYLWSGFDEYFANPLLRFVSHPVVQYLRFWERVASKRPDVFLAISKEVQQRVSRYYQRSSEVIYPPIGIDNVPDSRMKKGSYFLVVSRLVAYKRVDLAIKACNELHIPLKIVGTGSQMSYLRKIAGNTVAFLGNLTDEELVEYYKGCLGLIFPGREDFGLTILEAQQYGKPVIAFKAGGAVETIIDKKTGLFFYPQTITALTSAIKRFYKITFDRKECMYHAALFSKKKFQKEFLEVVSDIMTSNTAIL